MLSALRENVDTGNVFCGPAFKSNTVILHWMRQVKNRCWATQTNANQTT